MHILSNSQPIYWNSEIDCEKLATTLAQQLTLHLLQFPTIQIWLEGDLGTGKTTFVRYLLRALGHTGKVKSPTYTLCEQYHLEIDHQMVEFHHFDLYRMNTPNEWEEAGFKDILTSPGICLIEWPEKADGTLPTPDLILQLNYQSDTTRMVKITSYSLNGQALLASISNVKK